MTPERESENILQSEAPTIDLRETATVLVEERGSAWADPSDDVVLAGLITALNNADVRVRERAERTLREIDPERLTTWLRAQLMGADAATTLRLAPVIARLHLTEMVPDLVDLALRTSSADLDVIARTLKSFPHFRELIEWIQAPDDLQQQARVEEAATRRETSLAERLEAADGNTKIGIIERLPSKIEVGPVSETLIALTLDDPSDAVRLSALGALRRADLSVRLQAAEGVLKRGSVPMRLAALDLISGGTVDEMSILVRVLHDKSPNVAKEAIARLGSEPAPETLAILWGALLGVSRERQRAILGLLERFDRRAVSLLARQLLRSSQARERTLGVWVLGRIAPKESRALLLEALTDPSPEVRIEAVAGLQTVEDPEVVNSVGQRIRDPEPSVRVRAVEILGSFDAGVSASYLIDACKDPADEVRERAEAAILGQRPDAVAPLLVERLASPSHRRIARNLLERLGSHATPALVAAVPEAKPQLAEVIAEVLSETGAEAQLLEDLEAREPAKRISALDGLRVMNATDHLDAIVARLEDPVSAVRVRAAESLGALGNGDAVEPLKTSFVSDPDMAVVAAIEIALRKLTEDQRDPD
jgi:HEAT repeat protein